mmetsp:Transcript_16565/g.33896  ORF Transcript_16565/g.33896 Transcript_16565/m.33896 type:complete len:241 (-) Transcript_16565:122-844(-)
MRFRIFWQVKESVISKLVKNNSRIDLTYWPVYYSVSAADDLVAGNLTEIHTVRLARFKSLCSARWNIQSHPQGANAVKLQHRIALDKMIVTSNLNWPVTCVGHEKRGFLPPMIQDNIPMRFGYNDLSWCHRKCVDFFDWRKDILRWYRKKRPIQSHAQIPILLTNWVVNSNKLGSIGECPFNLDFMHHVSDTGQYLSSSQQLPSNLHQLCHRRTSVPNQFHDHQTNKPYCLCGIKSDPTG